MNSRQLLSFIQEGCESACQRIYSSREYISIRNRVEEIGKEIDRKTYLELEELLARERTVIDPEIYLQGIRDGLTLSKLLNGSVAFNELREHKKKEGAPAGTSEAL